jgi:hypothetical protein
MRPTVKSSTALRFAKRCSSCRLAHLVLPSSHPTQVSRLTPFASYVQVWRCETPFGCGAGSAGGRLLCAAAGLDLAAATQLLLLADLEAAQSRNSALRTALHYAAQKGHTATCKLLLDAAPHMAMAAADDGCLPLHLAANRGRTASCRLLLGRAPKTAAIADNEGWPHFLHQ